MLKEHMCTKFGWTTAVHNTIDWQRHGSNLTRLDFYRHRFIVKLIHERLPLQGEPFYPSTSTTCPCCNSAEESHHHFLNCKHNQEPWNDLLPSLTTAYNKFHVDPILSILINLSLEETPLLATLHRLHPTVNFSPYHKLIKEQVLVGVVYGGET